MTAEPQRQWCYAAGLVSLPVQSGARTRLDSVDVVRGIVMVVMAIDHVRDFFHDPRIDPTDLEQTTTALFFTRWITHYCAPVFVLLAGSSAYLATRRGRSTRSLSRLLLTRGAWLVVLELTVVRFGWFFNLNYRFSVLQVIWTIGWSMIVLAGLVWLPCRVIFAFGAVLVVGHNLLDSIHTAGAWQSLWLVVHDGGTPHGPDDLIFLTPDKVVLPLYPLVPWVGVLALGYVLGEWLTLEPAARRRRLLRLGLGLTAAFLVMRWSNLYGDPVPWAVQGDLVTTVMSFLDCEKYPPSLSFLLMTLGPALILLAVLPNRAPRVLGPLVIYGRVPLFYYVLHIPLIHVLAGGAAIARFGTAAFEFGPENLPDDYALSLPAVYLVWIGVVASLYPACRWFAAVKKRRTDWWLTYL
jgi:uncharacterized membrane protein